MNKIYFDKKDGQVDFGKVSEQVKSACLLLPNGKWQIQIVKQTNKRSNNQNRLLMLWCNCIASYMTENSSVSCTGADVKELMKLKFLAIDTPLGKMAKHTSKLTTEEMNNFLNNVQAYFETFSGILLPLPSDLLFDEFERKFGA